MSREMEYLGQRVDNMTRVNPPPLHKNIHWMLDRGAQGGTGSGMGALLLERLKVNCAT